MMAKCKQIRNDQKFADQYFINRINKQKKKKLGEMGTED